MDRSRPQPTRRVYQRERELLTRNRQRTNKGCFDMYFSDLFNAKQCKFKMSMLNVQGDTSGCSPGFVAIKAKVVF